MALLLVKFMARTSRVRVTIIKMLKEFVELDTGSIYEKLNDSRGTYGSRHGVTQAALNNVLGKEPVFVKLIDQNSHHAPRTTSLLGDLYPVCYWGLNYQLLEKHSELNRITTNSYRLQTQLK